MALLSVNDLSVCFDTRDGVVNAVQGLSFSIDRGDTLGIVGESGSGKSVSCYSLLKLLPSPPCRIASGEALFDGQDLLQMTEAELRAVRGKRISMIFQDPMTSLNPFMRVGDQIAEPLLLHEPVSRSEARQRALELLREVGIRDAEQRIDQYPHEFSGGMRQRVMIAMALITQPEVLIADEPTTALDVTIQAQILTLIKELQQRHNLAVIFISHDLNVVRQVTDQVIVMRRGEVVERGASAQVFAQPQHDYTRELIAAVPDGPKPEALRNDLAQAGTLLEAADVTVSFATASDRFVAVDDVSIELHQGEILGLVGESGCGKTTLSQSIVRLVDADSGRISLSTSGEGHAVELQSLDATALREQRKNIQMIFQDPYASLNPRMTVFKTLAEPIQLHGLAAGKSDLKRQVLKLMSEVGLNPNWANKYPHEFSGGQRQRIAIARALAVEPRLIIADEPVSALDVTIQAQILELLLQLAKQRELSMIFISHDLAVVRYVADRIAVMRAGKIVEYRDTEALYSNPEHEYTRQLLAASAHG